ncbi:MAG TPA: RNA polymerase subunit sigma, partial [Verrucomicrobiales bacterium]|nr:RNA polymerase subunit sigma [Verrucomicrobiales bacterium]
RKKPPSRKSDPAANGKPEVAANSKVLAKTAAPKAAQSAENQTPEEALASLGNITNQSGVDLTEKIKELVRLAQEQGYLTYGDINDALPENIVSP